MGERFLARYDSIILAKKGRKGGKATADEEKPEDQVNGSGAGSGAEEEVANGVTNGESQTNGAAPNQENGAKMNQTEEGKTNPTP